MFKKLTLKLFNKETFRKKTSALKIQELVAVGVTERELSDVEKEHPEVLQVILSVSHLVTDLIRIGVSFASIADLAKSNNISFHLLLNNQENVKEFINAGIAFAELANIAKANPRGLQEILRYSSNIIQLMGVGFSFTELANDIADTNSAFVQRVMHCADNIIKLMNAGITFAELSDIAKTNPRSLYVILDRADNVIELITVLAPFKELSKIAKADNNSHYLIPVILDHLTKLNDIRQLGVPFAALIKEIKRNKELFLEVFMYKDLPLIKEQLDQFVEQQRKINNEVTLYTERATAGLLAQKHIPIEIGCYIGSYLSGKEGVILSQTCKAAYPEENRELSKCMTREYSSLDTHDTVHAKDDIASDTSSIEVRSEPAEAMQTPVASPRRQRTPLSNTGRSFQERYEHSRREESSVQRHM